MVRGGPAGRAVKKAKIFAITKGFRGRRKNCYSLAVRAAHKALQYAYVGRRLKKRDMRKLWIQRINSAAQEHGIKYSRFMYNLVKCNVQLNRKVLSELAIHEPQTFQALAELALRRSKAGLLSALAEEKITNEAVKMSSEVQLDALPYIDQGYDDHGVREAAMLLVEEETKRYRPTKNYLEFLPTPKATFETAILRAEFDRQAARQPMELLSMKRYELPQPSSSGQKNDVGAWQESVDNSMAQLEHQAGRIINLELLSQYSSGEWQQHNKLLALTVEREQKQLKELRNNVQEVNWLRKTEQTTAGAQLQALSSHWSSLVHKNFEIECACQQLEGRLAQLQQLAKERGIEFDAEEGP